MIRSFFNFHFQILTHFPFLSPVLIFIFQVHLQTPAPEKQFHIPMPQDPAFQIPMDVSMWGAKTGFDTTENEPLNVWFTHLSGQIFDHIPRR